MATARGGIKLTGWPKLTSHIRGIGPELEKEVGRATRLNAHVTVREMRKRIRAGGLTRNADLTSALKGSSKPLVDFADLFKAHTIVVRDWKTAFAGILRTARDKSGKPMVNLAFILHEGHSLNVTERMRGLFSALASATQRGDPSKLTGRARDLYDRNPGVLWKPLRPSTTVIVIPARPWMRETLESSELRKQVSENWNAAVERAFRPKK